MTPEDIAARIRSLPYQTVEDLETLIWAMSTFDVSIARAVQCANAMYPGPFIGRADEDRLFREGLKAWIEWGKKGS